MRPERFEKEEPVQVDVLYSDGNPELKTLHVSGKTLDISEMGMKVTMSNDLPPKDSRVGLQLELGDKIFRLEGEVRWTVNSGQQMLGVELDDASGDYAKWVEMFDLGLE